MLRASVSSSVKMVGNGVLLNTGVAEVMHTKYLALWHEIRGWDLRG